jgi:hypothetical protein
MQTQHTIERPKRPAWFDGLRRAQPALLVALAFAAPAARADDPYVPITLDPLRTYSLPSNYSFHFPLIVSFDDQSGALPWQDYLGTQFNFTPLGRKLLQTSPDWVLPMGFQAFAGPNYPDPATHAYPAGIFLVRYTVPACPDPDLWPEYLATPAPPSYVDAKADADAWCAATCGVGFEMSDFDMNQWQIGCFKFNGDPQASQVATWGGSQCSKVEDNGLLQPCNPLEPLIDVRQYLGQPASACPACDLDEDGQITLVDLTMARNTAFGPLNNGLGESRAIMVDAEGTMQDTMTGLDTMDFADKDRGGFVFEITHWETGIAIDCLNNDPSDPDSLAQRFDDIIAPQEGAPMKEMADAYCEAINGPGAYCSPAAISYSVWPLPDWS